MAKNEDCTCLFTQKGIKATKDGTFVQGEVVNLSEITSKKVQLWSINNTSIHKNDIGTVTKRFRRNLFVIAHQSTHNSMGRLSCSSVLRSADTQGKRQKDVRIVNHKSIKPYYIKDNKIDEVKELKKDRIIQIEFIEVGEESKDRYTVSYGYPLKSVTEC
ncbi:MAG: hypothetical protein ACMUEM_06385 [Flavobacteriales bacterium AspAUS03]